MCSPLCLSIASCTSIARRWELRMVSWHCGVHVILIVHFESVAFEWQHCWNRRDYHLKVFNWHYSFFSITMATLDLFHRWFFWNAMSGTRSVRPPGTGSGQGRTGSCVASTLWEKVKKCLWCFVFIWSWRVMSVRPSLWYTTESFYVCVCVRPPTWAGPDWIMFLNHSCNYVFVQLDQTVCQCVRPCGLDRASPNFSLQDVFIRLFIAILQTSEYCRHISLEVLSCSSIPSTSTTLLRLLLWRAEKNKRGVSVVKDKGRQHSKNTAWKLRRWTTSFKEGDKGKLWRRSRKRWGSSSWKRSNE